MGFSAFAFVAVTQSSSPSAGAPGAAAGRAALFENLESSSSAEFVLFGYSVKALYHYRILKEAHNYFIRKK